MSTSVGIPFRSRSRLREAAGVNGGVIVSSISRINKECNQIVFARVNGTMRPRGHMVT